jgi:uncharacterized protein YbcV (DUF1398 family)
MKTIARQCLEGAETNTMTFPQVVSRLMSAGFEGYAVDFRQRTVAYYSPTGETAELPMTKAALAVAADFNAAAVKEAIREAQTLAPGYTYKGFVTKVAAAGCAGYIVSFLGRRVLYFGRNADTHVEHFPN